MDMMPNAATLASASMIAFDRVVSVVIFVITNLKFGKHSAMLFLFKKLQAEKQQKKQNVAELRNCMAMRQ